MAMFQVIGINTSYGVFQQFYTSPESFLDPGTPQSAIAFVGTLGTDYFLDLLAFGVTDFRIWTELGVRGVYLASDGEGFEGS